VAEATEAGGGKAPSFSGRKRGELIFYCFVLLPPRACVLGASAVAAATSLAKDISSSSSGGNRANSSGGKHLLRLVVTVFVNVCGSSSSCSSKWCQAMGIEKRLFPTPLLAVAATATATAPTSTYCRAVAVAAAAASAFIPLAYCRSRDYATQRHRTRTEVTAASEGCQQQQQPE
jgi:hypothetical protein